MKYAKSAGCCLVRPVKAQIQICVLTKIWKNGSKGIVLPKGTMEKGESPKDTAKRETQ